MTRITINTRITYKGNPGEVTGIRRKPEGGLLYEVTLDVGDNIGNLEIDKLKREDGKKVKMQKSKPTVGKLIKTLKKNKDEYKRLKKNMESRGLENLNMEETEEYGCYIGKYEMLTIVIGKLKDIQDAKK